MLRRSHKKSKNGCEQCKQRHVKCDEGRPSCRLCTTTDLRCSYSTLNPPITPNSNPSPDPNHDSTGTLSPTPNASNDVVNTQHMELFHHLITNRDLFSLGDTVKDYKKTFEVCLQESFKAPHLLHSMLAFSARHLSVLYPDRREEYRNQANRLQMRAISLFYSTITEVDSSNCVAIVLFSVTLGHHVLADALSCWGPKGLEGFLDFYLGCLKINRGIHNIAVSAWPLLVKSEIESVLSWSRKETAKEPTGSECEALRSLISEGMGFYGFEKEACYTAINHLQLGFDALISEDEGVRYRMIFQWTLLMSPEFQGLIKKRKPEALVLLSYYGLLLHYGKTLWQVKNAGELLVKHIQEYLGREWLIWLEYPIRMIQESN
ncbi:hypothetical protein NW752_003447 [Fusarium irregulare]|uniref:Zn(2)-C6 fungal-type domain-containing protein n=1 Tax=Fusarium irregulare TaxID=2494466 RepID=A0A9W8PSK9_9HYPO|nr:hypothetical protein NW766_004517 [Fusarium irregulare]KAJ4022991.1 hypothetical protein NW752_003447 [Fusarium irregulare]